METSKVVRSRRGSNLSTQEDGFERNALKNKVDAIIDKFNW